MIGRKMIAHILNRIIIVIPALVLVWAISKLMFPNYFIVATDESGVFVDLALLGPEYMAATEIIHIILPTLMSMIFIDIITIALMKGDIGMKIMGLKIVSIKDKPLSLIKIIIRTIIKYSLLAFFPFLLVYIFINNEKMTLYDKISSTKVVEKKN
jgi:uncharacterized RDD family membrane protein YckC